MKAFVDKDTCTGCELCVDTCPEIFYMDGETASANDMADITEVAMRCVENVRGELKCLKKNQTSSLML